MHRSPRLLGKSSRVFRSRQRSEYLLARADDGFLPYEQFENDSR